MCSFVFSAKWFPISFLMLFLLHANVITYKTLDDESTAVLFIEQTPGITVDAGAGAGGGLNLGWTYSCMYFNGSSAFTGKLSTNGKFIGAELYSTTPGFFPLCHFPFLTSFAICFVYSNSFSSPLQSSLQSAFSCANSNSIKRDVASIQSLFQLPCR